MPYTIAGVTYETAAGVVNAFAPDGDAPDSAESVVALVDKLTAIAASDGLPLTNADIIALDNAFCERYGIEVPL